MINQLKELIQTIRPVKTKFELIRIGGNNDGGYLIPDDLHSITTCFSPGVDVTASFEQDLLSMGVRSHLADASVDGPPKDLKVASFTKKYLGGYDNKNVMTMKTWVDNYAPANGDLILQMDIEGAEYTTLLCTPSDILRRFRIIAVEIHNVQTWFTPFAWPVVTTFFEKLLEDFHVVHNHPNNNCVFVQVDDTVMPSVFELTLLRKDRSDALGYVDSFPHPLDMPNVLDKPDRPLPKEMYGE